MSVVKGASRIGLATLASRILGLAREQVLAYSFGASNAMDAFNIAFRVPNLLRDLFAEGAMSAAFVPNFTRALLRSREEAFRLLVAVLLVLVLAVGALSALAIVFCEPLTSLYASSYRAVPGKFELVVGLTRVMFPFFPFVAMAAVLMGALNALGFFFLPAFAPVLFNVASIICALGLAPLLSRFSSIEPIYAMAIGVLTGGFLQFYVQWRQMRKEGLLLRTHREALLHPFRVPGVKDALLLMAPGTIGLAATQLGILVNSIYATSAGAGAVSWLNYAFRLMQFPIGIFGVSLAAAALPEVSRRLERADRDGAGGEVHAALRMTLAVNLPAAAGLMAIGLPIVQMLFEHGRFTGFDSKQTAAAVFWYAAGLPGYSAVKLLVPVHYALGATRLPVTVSFAMVFLNILLNQVFISILHLPFWSLAAATSITATLNALLLAGMLRSELPRAVNLDLARAVLVQLVSSVVLGVASSFAVSWVSHFALRGFPGLLNTQIGRFFLWGGEVFTAIIVGIMLWILFGAAFGIAENRRFFQFLCGGFTKKLRRTE